jgi:hypothetical protein
MAGGERELGSGEVAEVTWKHQKPPSGIPARGAGYGGPAKPKPRKAFTAEEQPTPEAKAAGHEAAKTAREIAKEHAEEMARLMVTIARDVTAPLPTRLDAANKLVERAEGRAAQAIGGDPNGVPMKTVVVWDDDPD